MSWNLDWSKRHTRRTPSGSYESLVWGRNLASTAPKAREWHWVARGTLRYCGTKWKPVRERLPRFIGTDGYAYRSKGSLSVEEIALADRFHLWRGHRTRFCLPEHRLVAAKKYGDLVNGALVRHVNGNKQDNRPENLILGTAAENNFDHITARREAVYWRTKYQALVAQIKSGEALAQIERCLK